MTQSNRRSRFQRFSRRVRRQLLWIFVSFGLGFGLTWYYSEEIFALVLAPAGGMLSPTGVPIFTSPTEMFSATIRLAITGGVVASLPMLSIGISRLLIPFLLPRERKFIFWFFVPAFLLCFLAGVSFAYYVLLPAGLGFLLNFGTGIASPMIRISEYLSMATAMVFWLGVVFELPLFMFMLSKLRIVTHQRMRRIRKYVPPTAVIFAAIITPTFDGLNVMLIAVPLTVLYEVGLVLAWLGRPVERRRWNPLRLALVEAVIMTVLVAGVVGILWYAGVIGGVR